MSAMPEPRSVNLLGAPETRRFLNDFVRRRVAESHVDDVVQTVLVNALEAPQIPSGESELRRWLTGIAKHKIADLHRKSGREQPSELPDIESAPPPVEERLMAEWAESQAKHSKDAERTLRWMAREGEGEKLEQIAAEEKIEAATVRQRVSRMRRWMKERWIAELAAVAALALLGVMIYRWLRAPAVEVVRDAPTAVPIGPIERAHELRRAALESCDKRLYRECLEGLDRAKELDPSGDGAPEVQGARAKAKKAIDAAPESAPKGRAPEDDGVPDDRAPNDAGPSPTAAPRQIPTAAPKGNLPAPKKPDALMKGDAEPKKAPQQEVRQESSKPAPPPPLETSGPLPSDAPNAPREPTSSFGNSTPSGWNSNLPSQAPQQMPEPPPTKSFKK
jgi:RNA polymerase sigma factor (sigma-70 family)